MSLTPKQEKFVQEYLVDLNATQAAIRAGYSSKTAAKIGSENLIKPDIQVAIQKQRDKMSKKAEITVEGILKQIQEVIDDPETIARDKLKALEMLAKHLGMFVNKIDIDITCLTTELIAKILKGLTDQKALEVEQIMLADEDDE
ncbi:MAG: terminase small subunit [Aestuariibacter sp.]|nr:terminase small subunit [Aestuariibacter sp.]